MADVSQSLGLTVLGTALSILGSMLEGESSAGETPLTRADARSQ